MKNIILLLQGSSILAETYSFLRIERPAVYVGGNILIFVLLNAPQYTPLTAHLMPNFPHIDKDNSYLMVSL